MAQSKELLPIYLFLGEDKLKREALLQRMQQRVSAMGDLSLNQNTFEAGQIEPPDAVAAACNTVPFLSDMRLVVVKNCEELKKPVLDSLAEYAKNPMSSTVLVLTGTKLNKQVKLYKTVKEKYPKGIVECELKKKRSDIEQFIRKICQSAGVQIEGPAASLMFERLGNSTVAIDTELKKLIGYVSALGRNTITLEDAEKMVTRMQAPKPWDFTAALSARDTNKCMSLIQQMSDQEPLGLLIMSTKRIRELLVTKSLDARPFSPPVEQVLGGKDWLYRNHHQWACNFSEDELISIMSKASVCEMKMKSGYDPQICFDMWVLGVCTGVWAE